MGRSQNWWRVADGPEMEGSGARVGIPPGEIKRRQWKTEPVRSMGGCEGEESKHRHPERSGDGKVGEAESKDPSHLRAEAVRSTHHRMLRTPAAHNSKRSFDRASPTFPPALHSGRQGCFSHLPWSRAPDPDDGDRDRDSRLRQDEDTAADLHPIQHELHSGHRPG